MMNFKINARGYWETIDDSGHVFDQNLCDELLTVFQSSNIKTICDLGCGMGYYTKTFIANKFFCEAYDGNPNTELLTNGVGKVLDLSDKVELGKTFDCVLSLEVGEHIPQLYEQNFIDNICTHSHNKIILSWAIPGQIGDGHVNCQENEYIIEQFERRGFVFKKNEAEQLRKASVEKWFKNSILVFEKKSYSFLSSRIFKTQTKGLILKIIERLFLIKKMLLFKNSSLFNKDFYLNNYPDVKASGIDPVKHYLIFGGGEGRNPSLMFNSSKYLEMNPDVAEAGINPLLHFLKYGKKEGRRLEYSFSAFTKKDRNEFIRQKLKHLSSFLAGGEAITFPGCRPQVSIIIVLFNRAELTLACLKSVAQNNDVPFELIIVDNNSTDETQPLLKMVKGAKVIQNRENVHFLKACNQAVKLAKSPYLLFLNNDTEIHENAISRAINTFRIYKRCGAVGGKVILPGGGLQEAGSIIWKDGSCLGYGRGQSPDRSEFNFHRVVDYCSGVFLLTSKAYFNEYGGFDERFAPAYYEETDYCLWLQQKGYEVIYNPGVIIHHFEFGGSSNKAAIELQAQNQKIFANKHKHVLSHHFENNPQNILKARFAASLRKRKNILYIDDRIPYPDLGSGYPRSNSIVNILAGLGYQLTIYPNTFPNEGGFESIYRVVPPFAEVAKGYGVHGFLGFIKERQNYYDIIWISRPHNMQLLKPYLDQVVKNYRLVYDAEAIFAERDLKKVQVQDSSKIKENNKDMIVEEVSLTIGADITFAVSEQDAQKFRNHGNKNVKVLGHFMKTEPGRVNFDARKDMLFVGNLDHEDSPNADSILWFVNEVLPLIRQDILNIKLHIVGSCKAQSIKKLEGDGIVIHGRVDDLRDFYNSRRVFIAPTRYSAGIPYKVHEAASYGLPTVGTELLASQLGWLNTNCMLYTKPDKNEMSSAITQLYKNKIKWYEIRNNALKEIRSNYSKSAFEKVIFEALK